MAKAKLASAIVEFTFRSSREAEAVQRALKPEEKLPAPTRCEISIRRKKNVLCLQVNAENTAVLRAALNSFMRWAIVARDMVEMEGGKKWKNCHLSCAIS